MITRRDFQRGLAGASLALLAGTAAAQAYPNKPIKLVLSFGPGSGSDAIARILTEDMSKAIGQPIIIDYKPGAAGAIAAEYVAHAPPDGYTILLTTTTVHSINPHIFKKLSYDPLKDFTSVGRMLELPMVLAVPGDSKINTLKDLLDFAKANPGKLNFGYGNSTSQVAGSALRTQAGLTMTGVAYKSAPQVTTDLLGSRLDFAFLDLGSSLQLLKAGKLKPIAFSTPKRSSLLPSVATLAEDPGFAGFDVGSWVGIVGPAGMPRDIVAKLNSEITRTLNKPEIRERYAAISCDVSPSTAEAMDSFVKLQYENWRGKIRDAGIQPE